ncbi:amino acid permease [Paenibacillus sp. Soil787]|uniref:amino acid permease n=1 Tax=Paenibacillus sp. Soil787 TaxID=1736411 RepID=UPI000703652D|nr:amino acid permease [Paenibacillus sp. Soil787]KRF13534.1 amino acid transporter [Paenibacillus sp. Soil787]
MTLGLILIAVALIVMLAIYLKAKNGVKLARQKGHTGDDLNAFGYKQELRRDMGGFSNFAISFSVISILTGGVTLFGFGFNQGGPAIMGMGWPIVVIFVLFLSAAIAELTSSIPTSGAIYHWASILGNPGYGWFSAWFNMIGQVTIVAGIDYGCAGFASSLLFENPTKSETLLVYAIILLSHAALNHVGIRIVSKLNDVSAFYHLIGVGLIIGALIYFGPTQDVSYLFDTSFSTVADSSTPYWFAFIVGLLQAQWTITGYDASAHTSEETVDAKVRAPWGVFISVVVSGIFGFIMLALVTLSIKDPAAVAAAGGNAFIVAIEQAMGGVFGKVILWMVTFAMWFCGLSGVTSASRMIYAFSRDKGLPLSNLWGKVSEKFRTPANAIWITVLLAFLCGLLDNVYAVVTALTVIGLHSSYLIPLFLKLRAQMRGVWTKEDNGPWSLGNWSVFVNVVAIAWVLFLDVLFCLAPNDVKVTEQFTIHYATGKAFAVLFVILIIMYATRARKHFKGPHLGTFKVINDRINSGHTSAKSSTQLERG